MQDFFHRQKSLWVQNGLDGEKTQATLALKSIAIIGAGGLGSALAYALCASGIGKVYVVDFDKVSLHNIHRQIVFELGDEGEDKAALFRRLKRRYDGVQILPYIGDAAAFFNEDFNYDLILDGTDNFEAREAICAGANKLKLPWIYNSVEGFHTQIGFFRGIDFDFFKDKSVRPGGIAAPIVMMGAAFAANLALRYLAGLEVVENELYYLDLSSGGFKTRTLKLGKNP